MTPRERVTSFSLPNYFRRFFATLEKIFTHAETRRARRKKSILITKSLISANPAPPRELFVFTYLSNGFKFGLGMLAAFITAGLLAVAVTGVMNSFQDGETLTAGNFTPFSSKHLFLKETQSIFVLSF